MIEIAPSILSADFTRLGEQIEAAERGGATIIHVDVMDGHFVPNITVGLPVVRSLARATRLPLDTHLMISDPGLYAEQFAEAGARMVSVHIEEDPHIHRTLASIRKRGREGRGGHQPGDEPRRARRGAAIRRLRAGHVGQPRLRRAGVHPDLGRKDQAPAPHDRRARTSTSASRLTAASAATTSPTVAAAGAEIFVAGTAVFGQRRPDRRRPRAARTRRHSWFEG